MAGSLTPNYGGNLKSHESDLLELAYCIYKDACAKCIAVKPDLRDLKTIKSRVEKEGLSFLTITLPQFGKDFERSLALERIETTSFLGFKKDGAIPAFLQGMLSQIFDRSTGGIFYEQSRLDDVSGTDCATVIEGIRQIAYAFKKLKLDCTEKRVRSTIAKFVETEYDLAEPVSALDAARFRSVAKIMWSNVFDHIMVEKLIPKHGPGATAEGISGNQKYRWLYWYDRLEPYFPLADLAYNVDANDASEFEEVTVVSEDQELPVKVTPVPKTQKGPRIIAIEPCCMQYAQQAIRRELYSQLGRNPLTSGHVNFTDQEVNRGIAIRASSDGSMATLDLSDASDRVIHDLAICMFDGNPVLRDAINACRSTRAKLPDGTIIGPLKKFASMGSALCFPVESMYFYTICVAALLEKQNLPVTARNAFKVSRSVYVYGDDIIIPTDDAIFVAEYLHKYKCKVNMSKSYWTGRFRESCGMDAFAGEEVTPSYIRELRPSSKRQASGLVSWVKTAQSLYKRGYWQTSSLMFQHCERVLGPLPYVAENSPGLGRISFCKKMTVGRWSPGHNCRGSISEAESPSYQRLEVKCWVAEPVYRTDVLDGYGALQKSLLNLATLHNTEESSVDELHMERSARHGAVALKRRWIPV